MTDFGGGEGQAVESFGTLHMNGHGIEGGLTFDEARAAVRWDEDHGHVTQVVRYVGTRMDDLWDDSPEPVGGSGKEAMCARCGYVRPTPHEHEHDHDDGGCTCGCPVESCPPCGGFKNNLAPPVIVHTDSMREAWIEYTRNYQLAEAAENDFNHWFESEVEGAMTDLGGSDKPWDELALSDWVAREIDFTFEVHGGQEFVATSLLEPILLAANAEVDRRVADAWDEGQKSGMRHADRMRAAYEMGRPELPGPPSPNPYRAKSIETGDNNE